MGTQGQDEVSYKKYCICDIVENLISVLLKVKKCRLAKRPLSFRDLQLNSLTHGFQTLF